MQFKFEADAGRAERLDQHMRVRLQDSLRYVLAQSENYISIDKNLAETFFSRLSNGPVSPQIFAIYYEIVLAIQANDISVAQELIAELFSMPISAPLLQIIPLQDPRQSSVSSRYIRFLDSDPTTPIELLPPSQTLADSYGSQIEAALRLIELLTPELYGEIKAVVREIILAVNTGDENYFQYGGASSFMMWGSLLMNASNEHNLLGLVQSLVHESAHSLLFGMCADGPVLENSGQELHASPLRKDPRPLDGIYHAVFVTARMYYVLSEMMKSGKLGMESRSDIEKQLKEHQERFFDGMETLTEYARLTKLGKAIIRSAEDYMTRAAIGG